MNKEFYFDIDYFKKKILRKIFFQACLYIFILGWSFFHVEVEKRKLFFIFSSGFLFLIFFFLRFNFLKQLDILKKMKIKIVENLLQIYSSSGECTNINLKRIHKIEKDKLGTFVRYSFFETEKEFTPILNILNSSEFELEVEKISNKKIEFFQIELKTWILKGLQFFVPSILALIFYYFNQLNQNFLFLIFFINLLFFFLHFSERRMRAGINSALVRRVCFMLFLLISFQIFRIFSN